MEQHDITEADREAADRAIWQAIDEAREEPDPSDSFGDPLLADEEPIAWLRRWRDRLTRTMRHRGCFRYLFPIARRHRREVLRAPRLPYPKIDLRGAA